MTRPPSEFPTDLELQFLKILWNKSPEPVREIRDALKTPGPDVHRSETMRGESWAARLAEVETQLLLRRPDLMQHRNAREVLCKAA